MICRCPYYLIFKRRRFEGPTPSYMLHIAATLRGAVREVYASEVSVRAEWAQEAAPMMATDWLPISDFARACY